MSMGPQLGYVGEYSIGATGMLRPGDKGSNRARRGLVSIFWCCRRLEGGRGVPYRNAL